jgi:hypothetical protein
MPSTFDELTDAGVTITQPHDAAKPCTILARTSGSGALSPYRGGTVCSRHRA